MRAAPGTPVAKRLHNGQSSRSRRAPVDREGFYAAEEMAELSMHEGHREAVKERYEERGGVKPRGRVG